MIVLYIVACSFVYLAMGVFCVWCLIQSGRIDKYDADISNGFCVLFWPVVLVMLLPVEFLTLLGKWVRSVGK